MTGASSGIGAAAAVDDWNENPTPFVWHKSADEILERLGRYCAAVTTQEFIDGSA